MQWNIIRVNWDRERIGKTQLEMLDSLRLASANAIYLAQFLLLFDLFSFACGKKLKFHLNKRNAQIPVHFQMCELLLDVTALFLLYITFSFSLCVPLLLSVNDIA